jgi:hypothetical protein
VTLKKLLKHKNKIIILFTIILLILITFPKSTNAQTPDATFSLQPGSSTFVQEADAVINININTGSNTSNAADIIINYNPSEIDVIQVTGGSAYESYAGNVIDASAGRIRLTGFSITGTLSGSRVFGTIKFRSKPNVESTSLTIVFSGVGNTLDSNIAETNTSTDILGSVGNGHYTFTAPVQPPPPPPPPPSKPKEKKEEEEEKEEEPEDTESPIIELVSPQNYETDIPLDANIIFKISDDISGVDINSVVVIINGEEYTYKDTGNFSYEGDPMNYTIIITPREPFGENTPIFVIIKANDKKGNPAQKTILFNVPPEATNCFKDFNDKLKELENCQSELTQCLEREKGFNLLPITGNIGKLSKKLGINIPGLFSLIALVILMIHPYWRNPKDTDTLNKMFKSEKVQKIVFIIGIILAILGIIDVSTPLSIGTFFLYIITIPLPI